MTIVLPVIGSSVISIADTTFPVSESTTGRVSLSLTTAGLSAYDTVTSGSSDVASSGYAPIGSPNSSKSYVASTSGGSVYVSVGAIAGSLVGSDAPSSGTTLAIASKSSGLATSSFTGSGAASDGATTGVAGGLELGSSCYGAGYGDS